MVVLLISVDDVCDIEDTTSDIKLLGRRCHIWYQNKLVYTSKIQHPLRYNIELLYIVR